jgi:tRNA A-37 threonylcarbamoyl transferase component Bud32
MARSAARQRQNAFRNELHLEAANRQLDIRFSGDSDERLLVELDSRPFIVLLPTSRQPLTPGRITKRIDSWPGLRGRRAAGHIVLAADAPLSLELKNSGAHRLGPHVAVVGLWGTKNELVASQLDADMALILRAAGLPQETIERAMARQGFPPEPPWPSSSSADRPVAAPVMENIRALRPGLRLDAYLLERRLGRGHSAQVWKAKVVEPIAGVDIAIGTDVALKVYFPSLLQGFQTLRIQREFSVAADLRHNNLARVYDLVLSPSRPFHTFMAMEYIDGPTLKTLIDARGKLLAEGVLSIGRQLFSALEEIHSEGALHRDVKAANIIVVSNRKEDLEIKLVDLGIVSIPSEDSFTAASVFLGSKHSAPLEQLTGGNIDERTDIYGAGSVLYHCLRGVPMYHNAGPEGAIVRRMLSNPEALEYPDTKTDAVDLINFVNRCIDVDPAKRPSTAAECVRLLEET